MNEPEQDDASRAGVTDERNGANDGPANDAAEFTDLPEYGRIAPDAPAAAAAAETTTDTSAEPGPAPSRPPLFVRPTPRFDDAGATPAPEPPPPPPPAGAPADDGPRYARSIAREYFESMVVTFVMAIFGMTFVTQAVKVPTGSMLNAILVEDHLMVNKFIFGPHPSWLAGILPYRDIRRGDIIVFKYPKNPEQNYVKRVIGLPGETIEVHGTRVYIDGKEIAENKSLAENDHDTSDLRPVGQFLQSEGARWTAYYAEERAATDGEHIDEDAVLVSDHGKFGVRQPYKIPDESYFCMGDNRDDSEDSRAWGTVPRENVVGRAMFVYWSVKRYEMDEREGSVPDAVMNHTRWDRTGTLIK